VAPVSHPSARLALKPMAGCGPTTWAAAAEKLPLLAPTPGVISNHSAEGKPSIATVAAPSVPVGGRRPRSAGHSIGSTGSPTSHYLNQVVDAVPAHAADGKDTGCRLHRESGPGSYPRLRAGREEGVLSGNSPANRAARC
jgi:hypothetical protein